MEILELQDQDRTRWDEYVCHSQSGGFFHLSSWKEVMESIFKQETHYLYAKENNRIEGVLPLLRVKNLLRGNYLTSLPGGVCAEHEEAADALIERAKELCREYHGHYMILRDGNHQWERAELSTATQHCTLVVKLEPDPERVWRKIKKRARQLTNQAIKANLEVNVGLNLLEDFYPAYSRSMAKKGTPTLGLKFFQKVAQVFPAEFNLIVVYNQNRVIGGGFIFYHKNSVLCSWGGMLREFYELHPNHLLYWETIKHSCERGYDWLDLGRSAWDSGTFTFKNSWGAEPRQLYQQCYIRCNMQEPPVGSEWMDKIGFRLFVRIWSHLPFWITEAMGPQLRKFIPFG